MSTTEERNKALVLEYMATFYEVRNDKIQTQVELMDFRVSTEKFDLSVLTGQQR